MNNTYPKGYCAISKANGHKHGDELLAKAIVRNCGTSYKDCCEKVEQQIEWTINNYDNINETCLTNALELVWWQHIGVATNELFNYINNKVAEKVELGSIKPW